MICASEQSVIVLDKVYDQVRTEFAKRGCYFLYGEELDKVRKTVIINGSVNAGIVGPQEGSKPRQVLVQDLDTLQQMLNELMK